ncbi:hypothetical protein [Halomonas sp. OfavH-34-E]|uniref:hypothetical protein n=1 Tax=Halomonas sp. OfavH-34-E TaxID=2954491 RepID=UPI00209770FF|nr:hypothetical protein [Halomonas sp. OfavH-34-E]MCO7218114.1 hypothetical protein [Halomonas sp. OfavH-34-E]
MNAPAHVGECAPARAALNPYDEAIRLALDNQDLRQELAKAERRAESAAAGRDRAKAEADQQRERAEKLAKDKADGKKELAQVRHQARQRVQQLEAELARRDKAAEEKPGSDPGPHATIKNDDESVMVQLAFNQVHIHEPDRWYMVSSEPLDKAENHQLVFCGLIDGIMAGQHAAFIRGATRRLAAKWRQDNGCQRVEDLELANNIVTRLEGAGYEMLADVDTEAKRQALAGIKGIGPATIQKVARAVRKAGGK